MAHFKQIVDPTTLSLISEIPNERKRLDVISSMTLASLKAKKRDMDEVIYYWTATAEGTKALRSQGMLDEVHGLYDMMEVVWPDERRIKDLRGLLQ